MNDPANRRVNRPAHQNPYDAENVVALHAQKTSAGPLEDNESCLSALAMFFVPPGTAFVAWFLSLIYARIDPSVDERYVLLILSWSWSVPAGLLAIWYWIRGHKAVAMSGFLFWLSITLAALYVLFAFWNG